MDIILLRHGIAQDTADDGTDSSRQLTAQGIERTKRAMRGLSLLIGTPGVILTSPKVRAAQTAHLLAQATGYRDEPGVAGVLAEDSPQDIGRFLLTHVTPTLVAVGHEPTLSLTAEWLCTGQPPTGLFELKKAGAIAVRMPDHLRSPGVQGQLIWSLPPSALRQMQR